MEEDLLWHSIRIVLCGRKGNQQSILSSNEKFHHADKFVPHICHYGNIYAFQKFLSEAEWL
jgi:hypothetical protein